MAVWAAAGRGPDLFFGAAKVSLTGAVQDESQLQENMSKLAVGSAEGRGPDPSFAAMVFWRCERVL